MRNSCSMTIKSIQSTFIKIYKCLNERKLHEALTLLQIQISANILAEYQRQLENQRMTYENILKYTITGSEDPERTKVYNKLLISIYELTDKVAEHSRQTSGYFPVLRNKKQYKYFLRFYQ